MAILQHGDKYQVVFNGSEWVITYTDDTALADDTLFNIGIDPEAESSGADELTADELASTSSVGSPAIGQVHDLAASEISSASSTDEPVLTQIVELDANEIASTSSIGSPVIGQAHGLIADELSSASSVGTPASEQVYGLTSPGLSSTSSVGSPTIGQVHDLTATEISVASSTGEPALTVDSGIIFKDGLSSFLSTWSGVHTAFSFNESDQNTGTDTTHDCNAQADEYAQAATSNYPNYGLDTVCSADLNGDMDVYTITDACMLLYIPEDLATGGYALFHNGGGTNAQMGQIRSESNGTTITLGITHNRNGTDQDYATEIITERGWVCVGFQFEDNSGNMSLWVNGVEGTPVARSYTLAYGSGNPLIGDGNGDPIPAFAATNAINGTGLLIANFVCDNPDNDNSSPAGCGNAFYTDYYREHTADALIASNIASASSVGTPAMGQNHGVVATDIAASSSVDSPAIGQAHELSAEEIVSNAVVASPVLGHIYNLSASGIAVTFSVEEPRLNWLQPDVPEERIYHVSYDTRVCVIPARSPPYRVPYEERIYKIT